MKLLAIHGAKASGKDTAAAWLAPFGYRSISFADPMKRSLQAAMGLDDYHLFDPAGKEDVIPFWNVTARVLMQVFGTEVMQIALPDALRTQKQPAWWGRGIWVERLRKTIAEAGSDAKLVVTDLRFRHEYEMLKDVGAVFWKVVRPGQAGGDAHASEAGLPDDLFDQVIANDGTLDDFHAHVLRLIPGGEK